MDNIRTVCPPAENPESQWLKTTLVCWLRSAPRIYRVTCSKVVRPRFLPSDPNFLSTVVLSLRVRLYLPRTNPTSSPPLSLSLPAAAASSPLRSLVRPW